MGFRERKAEIGTSASNRRTVESKVPQFLAFRFTLSVLIASLTVLILVAGCPSEKRQPIKPADVNLLKAEPNEVEPPTVEPNELQPTTVEPNEAEPTIPEPNELEPAIIEPNQAEPNQLEPLVAEPNKPEPNEAEPNEIEPVKAEPNEVKPSYRVTFHNRYAAVLTEYVDKEGMVDYDALRHRKPKLNQLLGQLAKLDPNEYGSWPKEDKIAFWINAYNVKMLRIIADNYPIESPRIMRVLWGPDSIRHIDKNIGGIWKSKFIVMDEEFTLKGIEERFFRKEFAEPRAFFALSLASLSSPPMRNEPFEGPKLYKQLDDQAKKFLSSPYAFKIDRGKRKVYLSAIFQSSWHGNEFVPKYGTDKKFKDQSPVVRAVLNFAINYISRQDKSFLETEDYSVDYMKYDWDINDSSKK